MSDVTALGEIKRGEEAERLMEHPLFKEAITSVRDGLIRSMSQSPLGDEKTHNRLVIAMQLLNQIETQIKDVMNTGKMASLQTKDKISFFARR